MRYLLTIYHDEDVIAARSPEEDAAVGARYFALADEMREAGAYVGGDGLQPIATATTVRVRDGERLTTDGPFAETKEQLGGFYLVECKDLDEAIEMGGEDPGAPRWARSRCGRSWTTRRGEAAREAATARARRTSAERLFRRESGRAVATLIRVLGDFDARRGRGAGGVRRRARALAARRRAGQPGARGSPPSPATARSTACAASAARPTRELAAARRSPADARARAGRARSPTTGCG